MIIPSKSVYNKYFFNARKSHKVCDLYYGSTSFKYRREYQLLSLLLFAASISEEIFLHNKSHYVNRTTLHAQSNSLSCSLVV